MGKRRKRTPEEIAEDERKHQEVMQMLQARIDFHQAKMKEEEEARERERLRRERRAQRLRRIFPFLPRPESHA